ncbi:hypothetical protein BH11PLA2_BH11PLA2_11540 [soil metagenome]
MTSKPKLTPDEIQERGMAALLKELGNANTMRFILGMSAGKGNYTEDRRGIYDNLTQEEFDAMIAEVRAGKKTINPEPVAAVG